MGCIGGAVSRMVKRVGTSPVEVNYHYIRKVPTSSSLPSPLEVSLVLSCTVVYLFEEWVASSIH